jgi:hypothetical protein
MLSSLLSNLDGVTKGLLQLTSLGTVAGAVDGEALDFPGGLSVGGCCSSKDCDCRECSVLERRGNRTGSESRPDEEWSAHGGR